MDFPIGLAAYLFLGIYVAFKAKTTKEKYLWENQKSGWSERGSYIVFVAVGWPILLFVIAMVWITGGYQKQKG